MSLKIHSIHCWIYLFNNLLSTFFISIYINFKCMVSHREKSHYVTDNDRPKSIAHQAVIVSLSQGRNKRWTGWIMSRGPEGPGGAQLKWYHWFVHPPPPPPPPMVVLWATLRPLLSSSTEIITGIYRRIIDLVSHYCNCKVTRYLTELCLMIT